MNKDNEITLSDSNRHELEIVAFVLKKPINEIVNSCLRGSTNLMKKD